MGVTTISEKTAEKLCSHFSSGFLFYHSVTKFKQPSNICLFLFRGLSHNIWKGKNEEMAFWISLRHMKWAMSLRQDRNLTHFGSELVLLLLLKPFVLSFCFLYVITMYFYLFYCVIQLSMLFISSLPSWVLCHYHGYCWSLSNRYSSGLTISPSRPWWRQNAKVGECFISHQWIMTYIMISLTALKLFSTNYTSKL